MPEITSRQWLHGYIRTAGGCLTLSVGLSFSAGILLIVQAWLMARTVHLAIFEGQGLQELLSLLWILPGLIMIRALLIWFSGYLSGLSAVRIKEAIRSRMLAKAGSADPAALGVRASGPLVDLIIDGAEKIDRYFSGYLPGLARAALVPAAILVCIFPLDWISGLILLATAPFIPLFMVLIGKKAESLNELHWQKITRLTHRFMDAIQGLVDLKLLNAAKREAEVVAAVSAEYGRTSLSILRVAFLSALVLEFMATVSVAVVAVIIGFRLLWGEMSFEAGFLILILAPEFYLPLRSLGTYFHSRTEALSAAERFTDFLQRDTARLVRGSRQVSFSRVELAFEGVSYSYEPGRQAFDNLSFKALQTGLTCIRGSSGRGKSTVLKLAAGLLVPDSGRITAGGLDLALVDQNSWKKHVAYLPQNPHLLSRSIAENIRLGNPDADLEKIKSAAGQALIARDIEALPGGYHYVPGEDGLHLSGGQRHRIALARIFVRECPVVLLDEPGTGLDRENRMLLLKILIRLAGSRAVIMTSHDPEMAAAAKLVVNI